MTQQMEYPSLFVDFIYYFNVKQDYYECHEVLEELWLEEGREPFYQGLLQVAVGLYHYQQGNQGGAIKMMQAALDKLQNYPDKKVMGINLDQVKEEAKNFLECQGERYGDLFRIEIVDPLLLDLLKLNFKGQ